MAVILFPDNLAHDEKYTPLLIKLHSIVVSPFEWPSAIGLDNLTINSLSL